VVLISAKWLIVMIVVITEHKSEQNPYDTLADIFLYFWFVTVIGTLQILPQPDWSEYTYILNSEWRRCPITATAHHHVVPGVKREPRYVDESHHTAFSSSTSSLRLA